MFSETHADVWRVSRFEYTERSVVATALTAHLPPAGFAAPVWLQPVPHESAGLPPECEPVGHESAGRPPESEPVAEPVAVALALESEPVAAAVAVQSAKQPGYSAGTRRGWQATPPELEPIDPMRQVPGRSQVAAERVS